MVSFADVEAARERAKSAVYYSPCPPSIPLSDITGMEIFCKLDYLQRTGSFKERGARNALAQLPADQKKRGVIAASAGNHAQALAYQGKLLGIPATVVMPKHAPLIKVTNCQKLGARVVLHGKDFAEAKARAHEIARGKKNSPTSMATMIRRSSPARGQWAWKSSSRFRIVDAVIVPVGGGGLIAGVSLAVKTLRPKVKVIAVEAENVASFSAALKRESRRGSKCSRRWPTVSPFHRSASNASRLRNRESTGPSLSPKNRSRFPFCASLSWRKASWKAPPPPLSLPVFPAISKLAGKRVVLLLCGGNIDPNVLSRVIERGLVADGRLSRFTAVISDRPGGLADLTAQIAASGASIKQVVHDRAFAGSDVSAVHVLCTVETRNREHLTTLRKKLRENGVETYDSR